MTHDWLYEPTDPAGTLSPTGQPYPHAVRGLKPAGRRVTGYGQTEPDAHTDARQKAREFDARETLGERGEVRQNEMVIRPGETARDAALRICRADKAAGYGVPWYMQELLVHIMTTGEVQP